MQIKDKALGMEDFHITVVKKVAMFSFATCRIVSIVEHSKNIKSRIKCVEDSNCEELPF